jgi:hypothetical protein
MSTRGGVRSCTADQPTLPGRPATTGSSCRPTDRPAPGAVRRRRQSARSPERPASRHRATGRRRARNGRLAGVSAGMSRELRARRVRAGGVTREVRAVDPGSSERAAIIAALGDWRALVGRAPRAREWSSSGQGPGAARWRAGHPRWPSASTVVHHFGGWSAGLQASGLPTFVVDNELPRGERMTPSPRRLAASACTASSTPPAPSARSSAVPLRCRPTTAPPRGRPPTRGGGARRQQRAPARPPQARLIAARANPERPTAPRGRRVRDAMRTVVLAGTCTMSRT